MRVNFESLYGMNCDDVVNAVTTLPNTCNDKLMFLVSSFRCVRASLSILCIKSAYLLLH